MKGKAQFFTKSLRSLKNTKKEMFEFVVCKEDAVVKAQSLFVWHCKQEITNYTSSYLYFIPTYMRNKIQWLFFVRVQYGFR